MLLPTFILSILLVPQEALSEEEAAFDPKDPNRPRFTLQELRDVLHERNELKAKVFMLQEEIAYYKRSAVLPCNWSIKYSRADRFHFIIIIKVTGGER